MLRGVCHVSNFIGDIASVHESCKSEYRRYCVAAHTRRETAAARVIRRSIPRSVLRGERGVGSERVRVSPRCRAPTFPRAPVLSRCAPRARPFARAARRGARLRPLPSVGVHARPKKARAGALRRTYKTVPELPPSAHAMPRAADRRCRAAVLLRTFSACSGACSGAWRAAEA